MSRNNPLRTWALILSTVVVVAAVAIMILLGLWQLSRLHQKEALLVRYGGAMQNPVAVVWPRNSVEEERVLYRRATVNCVTVLKTQTIAERSATGGAGIGHVAQCRLNDGTVARIVLGWSRDLEPPVWSGGVVSGMIAPGPRLVADPPVAGLAANQTPDPSQLPNNHLSYAFQWFAFAFVAVVIYLLALRRRLRDGHVS